MASRRLSADEAALWARVMAGVRPLGVVAGAPAAPPAPLLATPPKPIAVSVAAKPRAPVPAAPASKRRAGAVANVARDTLDGTWDRQLTRGLVAPDRTVDLHGHTLASAHALLDAALAEAIRAGDRIILLVTGKPPRPESERPHARGAIRAAVGDWLAGSRHSGAIAAVRAAHPRHGGAGALYIVLRKPRLPGKS